VANPEDITEESVLQAIPQAINVLKKKGTVRVVMAHRSQVKKLHQKGDQQAKLVKGYVSSLMDSLKFLLDQELPHTPFVAAVVILTEGMKALNRGGAAGKTPEFCCLRDTPNTIRGTLLVQGEQFSHAQIEIARELWKERRSPSSSP